MHRRFVSLAPEDSLLDAHQTMSLARLRQLPVLRDGVLLGVVSHRRILEASLAQLDRSKRSERASHLRAIPVSRVLDGPPEGLSPGTSLAEAAARLTQAEAGCLPVVERRPEGPRMVGLVTETDLLQAAYDPWFQGRVE